MKIKSLFIALAISLGVFTACTDKKKTEEKVDVEVIAEEKKEVIEVEIDEDEKRRLDSIRQVKEHGHAH